MDPVNLYPETRAFEPSQYQEFSARVPCPSLTCARLLSPPPAGCFQRVITRPAVEPPCIPGRYLPPVVGCNPFLSLEAAGVRASIALLLPTRPSIPPAMPLPDWDHVPPPESSARRAGCFKESWPGQPYRWEAPDKTGPVWFAFIHSDLSSTNTLCLFSVRRGSHRRPHQYPNG